MRTPDRIGCRASHEDRRPEGDRRRRAPGGARARGRAQAGRRGAIEVVVEAGAGEQALLPDALFDGRGRARSATPGAPTSSSRSRRRATRRSRGSATGTVLIGFLAPLHAARRRSTALRARGRDGVRDGGDPAHQPRAVDGRAVARRPTSRGYKAALLGAEHSTRFYPMLMTAAGTIPPAKVLVLGVGVAGLQALATARRLGAQTTGYDVRPEVAEQVAVAGRQVARPRHRGRGRGRLRARADRRGAGPAAAGADRRDQGLRRRHHDGAGARAPGAAARHRRGGARA